MGDDVKKWTEKLQKHWGKEGYLAQAIDLVCGTDRERAERVKGRFDIGDSDDDRHDRRIIKELLDAEPDARRDWIPPDYKKTISNQRVRAALALVGLDQVSGPREVEVIPAARPRPPAAARDAFQEYSLLLAVAAANWARIAGIDDAREQACAALSESDYWVCLAEYGVHNVQERIECRPYDPGDRSALVLVRFDVKSPESDLAEIGFVGSLADRLRKADVTPLEPRGNVTSSRNFVDLGFRRR
ncbi:MAG: hypothetical protein IT379_37995 [Deltaproteobacteria bacterium]|nr:hypothetical protein [Deltaproteobacteria bacterium]